MNIRHQHKLAGLFFKLAGLFFKLVSLFFKLAGLFFKLAGLLVKRRFSLFHHASRITYQMSNIKFFQSTVRHAIIAQHTGEAMIQLSQTAAVRLTVLALLLTTLACNMPGARLGGPEPPAQVATASAESLESFDDKWRDLNLSTPAGPFTITFTEAELSSALAEAIRQAEADGGEDIPIQNPGVVLQDGVINLYGQISTNTFEANGLIVAVPTIGPDGLVDIQISSAEFGPVELEPALLNTLVESIERSINEPIQSSPFDIILTTITIAGGQMTIDGTITP
jgi:hypothetical protein